MEAETETAHPSAPACASISTGSMFKVSDVSSTEEKGTIRSFRLRFHRASACAPVSVVMVHAIS